MLSTIIAIPTLDMPFVDCLKNSNRDMSEAIWCLNAIEPPYRIGYLDHKYCRAHHARRRNQTVKQY